MVQLKTRPRQTSPIEHRDKSRQLEKRSDPKIPQIDRNGREQQTSDCTLERVLEKLIELPSNNPGVPAGIFLVKFIMSIQHSVKSSDEMKKKISSCGLSELDIQRGMRTINEASKALR